MFWNWFGLQRMLDALFDDQWLCLGLPTTRTSHHDASTQPCQD
jgi:hypothetical protein